LNPLQAAILGMVQGLTEFLPISSSGHLILIPWLLGWPEVEDKIAFDAALHLGTILALLIYFWRDWLTLGRALLDGLGSSEARRDTNWRLAWFLILGSLPASLAGLAFEPTVEQLLREPRLVAILLIVFGLLLWLADRVGASKRGVRELGLLDVLVIGFAQVLALAPGVSRSGITITAGLLVGLNRASAARFSFLLSTPVTLAAALFSLPRVAGPDDSLTEVGVFLVGVTSAALFGILAIGFLLHYLRNNSLATFVWYRLLLGLLVLGVSGAGNRTLIGLIP
jgi:undecaprenyl-diphosphatase